MEEKHHLKGDWQKLWECGHPRSVLLDLWAAEAHSGGAGSVTATLSF